MRRFILALQFMTRLPLPHVPADEADFAGAIRWFPAAGLVVGTVVAGSWWLGVRHGSALAAIFALVSWVLVTGSLHLDGLGDIADAAGAAHKDRARLTAVLADPHLGSFGVVAICLQLLAKLILLLQLQAAALPALAVLPALARLGPLCWARVLPSLHEGLASQFRAGATWLHIALWFVPAGLAIACHPPLAIVIVAIPLWGFWLCRRIGGISGDGHGAGIELCETALLLALAVLS